MIGAKEARILSEDYRRNQSKRKEVEAWLEKNVEAGVKKAASEGLFCFTFACPPDFKTEIYDILRELDYSFEGRGLFDDGFMRLRIKW